MGWIGCICCKKFRHDFVAWTFALIAPVQPILHRVSCSNEMVPNAPKHYETQQKLSLGSNGVDQVRSLRKHSTQLCGTNFCINWTSSAHFALSLLSWQNNPKCTQTLRNATKVEFMVQWGGSGAFVTKTSDPTLWHELLHSSAHFALSLLCGTEFRFQWGGLGAFVVKTSDATLWHKLLH